MGAAAALVLAVTGGLFWQTIPTAHRETPVLSAARAVTTHIGQRDSVRLSDGTQVVLGPASRLTIAAGYDAGHRDVELQGDGYFVVRHDPAHPFALRLGDAVIVDIGTAFTVRSDRGDGVHVSVSAGAVQLRAATAAAGDSGVVLRVGDRGVVDPMGHVRLQRGGANAEDQAWRNGQLVFRDAPFVRVHAELQRWYGITLMADSALMGRHVTASFSHESVRQVLDVVALALGARYDMHGDTVLLHAGAASGHSGR